MNNMTVRLDSFSGPLDLLYHLIEKNEIDIYDIPIAELTEQYMEFISREENKNMDGMSEFIVMAADLIEIKSRMLLPKVQSEEPEEDPRDELVQKLLEYKKFKGVTEIFQRMEESASKIFFREPDIIIPQLSKREEPTVEECLHGLTMEDLYKAFREVMLRREKKIDRVRSGFKSVKRDNFTVDEKINPKIKFYDMFTDSSTKEEVLVTFLALLELIRHHSVLVEQEQVFGEIMIYAGDNLDGDESGEEYENE